MVVTKGGEVQRMLRSSVVMVSVQGASAMLNVHKVEKLLRDKENVCEIS